MPLAPIPEILEDLRAGRICVLVDDENRENEGDFICAASKVNVDIINFMTRVGAGYLCVALTPETCARLDLSPQAIANSSLYGTPMTVTVDGHPKHGVGTGVSAHDRVKSIQLLVDPNTTPDDFVRPGHINPLRARAGGVLVRTGQTEGSVDLARLAGLDPSAVIIEIVNEDGTMARVPDLEKLCAKYELKMCSVDQIIEYRLARETLVERMEPVNGTPIDLPQGRFNLIAYQSSIDPLPHLVFTVGDLGQRDAQGRVGEVDEPVLVRMHRRDLLGDIFHETENPTGVTLQRSLAQLQAAGRGALIYLRPESHSDGLRDRLQRVRRGGMDDVNVPDLTRTDGVAARAQPMAHRSLGLGSQILRDLGLRRLRVITNNPRQYQGLSGFGIEVVEQVAVGE